MEISLVPLHLLPVSPAGNAVSQTPPATAPKGTGPLPGASPALAPCPDPAPSPSRRRASRLTGQVGTWQRRSQDVSHQTPLAGLRSHGTAAASLGLLPATPCFLHPSVRPSIHPSLPLQPSPRAAPRLCLHRGAMPGCGAGHGAPRSAQAATEPTCGQRRRSLGLFFVKMGQAKGQEVISASSTRLC